MFNRFAVCEAYYLFASFYHSGMHSVEYGIFTRLSKIGFRAGPLLRDESDLCEDGRAVFDRLVAGVQR